MSPTENDLDEKDVDVIVVGAGLAGLETSRKLGSLGRRVVLIDAKHKLTERIHTTGIFVRRTLEDFTFPPDTLGPVVRDVTLYSPNGQKLELASEHDEFRVGRMGHLYSSLLDECRARGVTVLLGTKFVSAKHIDGRTSEVTVQSDQQQHSISTRLIVGADGARSNVAREIGLSENKRWIVGLEKVYRSDSTERTLRFHCLIDPRLAPGYLAWLVDDGEEIHLGVGGDPQKFYPKTALEEFSEWTKNIIEFHPEESQLIEQRGGRIPVGGLLPRIANERGLLVGDAAGAVSPLTAGGLDPCLRLSHLAVAVIDSFLETGDTEVFKFYKGTQWRRRFWKRLILRNVLERLSSRRIINTCWPLLNSSPGRAFARKVFFGRGSFPDVDIPLPTKARHQSEPEETVSEPDRIPD